MFFLTHPSIYPFGIHRRAVGATMQPRATPRNVPLFPEGAVPSTEMVLRNGNKVWASPENRLPTDEPVVRRLAHATETA